eukprot:CAMPEP_0169290398 /NCGR_PEP_ID=MMETSP1016-20121227/61680_1 /TAXON_ID=342587 /ORGANISM="Karlodinium micrum, Strain CCMP2283" /LENGTH=171 /DNA_ID=CAMNT_0009380909 /DNA_START=47 /DNA_END=559 /DNA_ORIENTATION=-
MAMRQFLVVSLWHSVVRGVDLATNQGIMRHDRASQAVLDHSGKAVIDTATLVALSSKTLEAKAANDPGDNPCSYLGCNSHKCEWASGGRISRVMAGISCSNAVVKGSGPDAATVKANTSVKIELLKDCVDVVGKNSAQRDHDLFLRAHWRCLRRAGGSERVPICCQGLDAA